MVGGGVGGWKMIHKYQQTKEPVKQFKLFEKKYQFCWMKSPVQVTSRLLSELFNANVIF